MKIRLSLILLLFVLSMNAEAQEPFYKGTKSLKATRIEKAPEIDGNPREEVWENLPLAENFFMIEPGNTPERKTHPTQVKIAYDDQAIYIAAYMMDNEPHRILRAQPARHNISSRVVYFLDYNSVKNIFKG